MELPEPKVEREEAVSTLPQSKEEARSSADVNPNSQDGLYSAMTQLQNEISMSQQAFSKEVSVLDQSPDNLFDDDHNKFK